MWENSVFNNNNKLLCKSFYNYPANSNLHRTAFSYKGGGFSVSILTISLECFILKTTLFCCFKILVFFLFDKCLFEMAYRKKNNLKNLGMFISNTYKMHTNNRFNYRYNQFQTNSNLREEEVDNEF